MGTIDDRIAIQDLLFRYCYLLDTGRAANVPEEIFTEDVVENHGTGDMRGRGAQRAFYGQYDQVLEGSAHVVTNVVIAVNGDTARSLSYVSGYHWLKSTSQLGSVRPCDFLQIACYEDALRREAEGWRIERRVVYGFGGQLGVGSFVAGIPVMDSDRPPPSWPS